MTASHRRRVPAILLRLGLLAGVLGILAGVLGMHVITGHGAHAAPPTGNGSVHHPANSPGMDQHAPDPSPLDACSSGTCPTMQTMAAECVPSPKTESLAAPLPGHGVLSMAPRGGPTAPTAGPYGYTPTAASPGELSISRT